MNCQKAYSIAVTSACISHSGDIASAETFNPALALATTDTNDRIAMWGIDAGFATPKLNIFKMSDGSSVASIAIGFTITRGVYVPSVSKFFVASQTVNGLDVIDLTGVTVATVDLSATSAAVDGNVTAQPAYDPSTDRVYMAGNRPTLSMTLIAINPSTYAVVETPITTPSPSPTVTGAETSAAPGYLVVDGIFTVGGTVQLGVFRLSDLTYVGVISDIGGGNACPALYVSSIGLLYYSTYNESTFNPEIWTLDAAALSKVHVFAGLPSVVGLHHDPINNRVIGQPRNFAENGVVINVASSTVLCQPAIPRGSSASSGGTSATNPVNGKWFGQSVDGSNNIEEWT